MLAPLQRRGFAQAGHGGAGVGVGNGQAQRVRRVGAGQAGQLQEAAHHFLDLALGRAAVADDGFFHLQGGVFGHRQVARHQGGEAGAARLAEQQGGLRVDVDEDDFHGGHVGLVARRDLADAVKQHLQPARQVPERQLHGADGAAAHVRQALALRVDDAKARGLQAGIDAENAHVLFK